MKPIASIPMREGLATKKELKPDFGTYHHSTPRQSSEIREKVKILFTKAFQDFLPFSKDDKLKILDVGCGLGFLSCVCAEFYSKSSIIGFDSFEHASLKHSSLEKARRNAKILGFSNRIDFKKGDFFRMDFPKKMFDLIVSNLVFHNFGKKRFDAYERLTHWTTPKSHVVLGDLFFDHKAEIRRLSGVFGSIEKISGSDVISAYKVLVLSKSKK